MNVFVRRDMVGINSSLKGAIRFVAVMENSSVITALSVSARAFSIFSILAKLACIESSPFATSTVILAAELSAHCRRIRPSKSISHCHKLLPIATKQEHKEPIVGWVMRVEKTYPRQ